MNIFKFQSIIVLRILVIGVCLPLDINAQLTQKWNKVISASSNMKFNWPYARYGTGRDHIMLSKSGNYVGINCNAGTNPYLVSLSTNDGNIIFQNTHSISGSGAGIDYDSTDNIYALSRVDAWGDSYLRKFTSNGGLSYTQTIANHDEDYMFMLKVSSSRVNVFGKNKKRADLTNSHSNYNYSLDGSLKWQNTISDYDWYYGYTVPFVADHFGNVIMTGKRQTSGNPQAYDGVIRKLDSTGAQKWQTYIDLDNKQDYVTDLIVDNIGDIYVSLVNGPDASRLTYIVKLDKNNGNVLWRKILNPLSSPNMSIHGSKLFVHQGSSRYIHALDINTGNLVWSKISLSTSGSIETDSKGVSYIISGGGDDSIQVVNYNGQILMNHKVLIPGYVVKIQSVAIDKNASYFYVAGTCVQGTTNHLFIAKYETPYTDSLNKVLSDSVGLHVSNVNAVCNKSVDVPIRVTAFRNMISMQGSINWNAADLRFDSIASYGPTALGLNAANFSTAKISNGQLTFSWNDPAGTGQTLADSTALITLRFTALGTTVRSVPVTVTGNPTPLEFYDAALVKKSSVQTAGSVNITCEFTISGKVLTPADKGVKNVTVTLTGGTSPITAVTDTAGNYSFKILPGTYTLTPSKSYEQFKTNGISTIDLVFIQAHILQRTPFTSAYKMFASDANNNSSVTTADILSIRRLILGTDTTLLDNRIWAFVDGGQTFANPLAPFPFSSMKTFTNQSTDVSHTFRGIKIGDVNYDRNPLLDQAPSGDTLRLFGEWIDTEDGYVTLKVKSRAVSGLLGWQSTLRWDAKQLQLQTTTGLINNLGIGERWKDEGYLTLSWNDPRAEGLSFTEGSTWMELRFRKTSALQRAGIGITEDKLGTEAFNGNYQSMGVKMEPVELRGNAWNGMLRVYPNPAGRLVNVEWKSARTGSGQIRLVDSQGRVVYQREASVVQGLNKARIEVPVGLASGSFVVQVHMGDDVNTASVLIGK